MSGRILNQKAFTLIELMAVMVIISTLGSVAVHKYSLVSETAGARALESALKELNVRESLIWINIKLSPEGWTDDETLFAQIDTNLGADFQWNPAADSDGGKLYFRKQLIKLDRVHSTVSSAGSWHN